MPDKLQSFARHEEVYAEVRSNLMVIELCSVQVYDTVEFFRSRVKELVRKENADPRDFEHIHRMSRMCFEMLTDNRISNMDALDVFLLYEVPQVPKFEWVFQICNKLRDMLQKPVGMSAMLVADHIAKNIENVMSS